MVLRNNSRKIIGIGETTILPDGTAECPEGYESNPVVARYIANGIFSVSGGKEAGEKPPIADAGKEAGEKPTVPDAGKRKQGTQKPAVDGNEN